MGINSGLKGLNIYDLDKGPLTHFIGFCSLFDLVKTATYSACLFDRCFPRACSYS